MSVSTAQVHDEGVDAMMSSGRGPRRRWGRRLVRWFLVVVVLGLVAVTVGVNVGVLKLRGGSEAGVAASVVPVATATVERRTLVALTRVNGTLGFAEKYEVFNRAQGTVTSVPVAGAAIAHGSGLYEVDGQVVYLLRGSIPLYRELSRGMKGEDVRQLNAELVALGYASAQSLDPKSTTFGWATYSALRKLQKHFGLTQTGKLPLTQAVFLPVDSILVNKVNGSVGAPASAGVLIEATSTGRTVTVALEPSRVASMKVGDPVTVILPDFKQTAGRVSVIGTIATKHDSGSPTIDVLIELLKPEETGRLDQAPVQVAITTGTVENVLAVPVNSLLAQSSGGYAIEVVESDDTRKLYKVKLGLFDDSAGMVQIEGDGVQAGQKIVVPAP